MAKLDDLDETLERHAAALLLFAHQFTRNQADAEDLVQESFVRFWNSRHRATDPVAYLYACVRNLAMDQHRSRWRRNLRERAAAAKESCPSLFLQIPEQQELASAVQQALSALPPEQASVLVMKVWGQLTFAQIAEALAIPPNTAASRYRYAAESLRRRLAREVQP